jgi:hypothetical protein
MLSGDFCQHAGAWWRFAASLADTTLIYSSLTPENNPCFLEKIFGVLITQRQAALQNWH